MKIYLFSYDTQILGEWNDKLKNLDVAVESEIDNITELETIIKNNNNAIILSDYDTVSNDVNTVIMNTDKHAKFAVLEKNPMIQTGKNLFSHKVRAYGNSRMLETHLKQLLSALSQDKTWSYPELTSALVKNSGVPKLSKEALALIKRLNARENETLLLVLEGYTNAAIAQSLDVSVRTIKAYMHAIFEKLHVNDRLSLVLLLK